MVNRKSEIKALQPNNLRMIALKITLTYQLPNYCRKNENTKTCLDVGTV